MGGENRTPKKTKQVYTAAAKENNRIAKAPFCKSPPPGNKKTPPIGGAVSPCTEAYLSLRQCSFSGTAVRRVPENIL